MTRRTVASECVVQGLGLFTGERARLTIKPGDEGLRFIKDNHPVRAHIDQLSKTPVHPLFASIPPRHTSVSSTQDSPPVHTIEHLMAALAGLGITDADMHLEGPEIPIADGSAQHITTPILEAGIKEIEGAARTICVDRTIEVAEDDAFIRIEPLSENETTSYAYELAYDPPHPLGTTTATWDGKPETFADSIAPARTYSFRSEAELMAGAGLFTAFTPKDLLVLDDTTGQPIDNAPRFDNEPTRHKLLDLIGDLALAGSVIEARITASRAGHALNHRAARALADLNG